MSSTAIAATPAATATATPSGSDKRQQVAVWFEIPVTDIDRASRFYEQLFGAPLQRQNFGMDIAVFPYRVEGGATGCLAQHASMTPSRDGSLLYLNADPSLDATLARATVAGGKVVLPRTALPPGMGFFAKIEDTEGNLVGLHALA